MPEAGGQTDDLELVDSLRVQARAWNERPLVRSLYRGWFRKISCVLSDVPGRSIELGSGIGTLALTCPRVELTDIEPTPWVSEVVDAEALPYEDGMVANLVLVDVFHHLARPVSFLDGATRALAPGGRIVVLDPYCSVLSTWAYGHFHHERTQLSVSAFEDDSAIAEAPLASNQARATLAFFDEADEFERRWPELRMVGRERLAFLAYPLSGGFTGRPLVPYRLGALLARVEPLLRPFGRLLAFRCLVVIERRG